MWTFPPWYRTAAIDGRVCGQCVARSRPQIPTTTFCRRRRRCCCCCCRDCTYVYHLPPVLVYSLVCCFRRALTKQRLLFHEYITSQKAASPFIPRRAVRCGRRSRQQQQQQPTDRTGAAFVANYRRPPWRTLPAVRLDNRQAAGKHRQDERGEGFVLGAVSSVDRPTQRRLTGLLIRSFRASTQAVASIAAVTERRRHCRCRLRGPGCRQSAGKAHTATTAPLQRSAAQPSVDDLTGASALDDDDDGDAAAADAARPSP